MTEIKSYQLREEMFGYTFYDQETLTHKFLKPDELTPHLTEMGITNPEIMKMQREDARADLLYSPIRLYYELTLACNRYCKVCYNSSLKPRPNELTTEQVIDSIEHLRDNNVLDLRFSGGEFTQRPDWYEILGRAKELGFAVSCNTNGVYKTAEVPQKLASLGLDQVTISIDGIKEHHDYNRGKGSFEKTMEGVRELHKNGATLRFNVLLSQLTLNDLEPMVELASNYTDEINFFPIRFIGRGTGLEGELGINWQEFYEFSQRAQEVAKQYPDLRILTFGAANRRTSVNQEENSNLGLRVGTTSGITTFNVVSDGGLWPGGYSAYIDPEFNMGNILTDNIFEVWQRNPNLEKLRGRAERLKKFCYSCGEYGKRCPGTVFEMELYRQKNPQFKNGYCKYGEGEPLLDILERPHGKE